MSIVLDDSAPLTKQMTEAWNARFAALGDTIGGDALIEEMFARFADLANMCAQLEILAASQPFSKKVIVGEDGQERLVSVEVPD